MESWTTSSQERKYTQCLRLHPPAAVRDTANTTTPRYHFFTYLIGDRANTWCHSMPGGPGGKKLFNSPNGRGKLCHLYGWGFGNTWQSDNSINLANPPPRFGPADMFLQGQTSLFLEILLIIEKTRKILRTCGLGSCDPLCNSMLCKPEGVICPQGWKDLQDIMSSEKGKVKNGA